MLHRTSNLFTLLRRCAPFIPSLADTRCNGLSAAHTNSDHTYKQVIAVTENSNDQFELAFSDDITLPLSVQPIEPLFSMLMEMPEAAVLHLWSELRSYETDSDLAVIYPPTGITRQRMLEQVQFALYQRKASR